MKSHRPCFSVLRDLPPMGVPQSVQPYLAREEASAADIILMKNRPLVLLTAYPIFHFGSPMHACALAQNNRQLRRVIPAAASRPCSPEGQLLLVVAAVLLVS